MIFNDIREYRAWIANRKKMVQVTCLDYESNLFQWCDENGKHHWLPMSKAFLMQSTGHLGKDETAIYEGDIVRFWDSDRDMEGDVDVVPIIGIVRYDGATMSYYFTNRIEADMYDILDGEYPVEVLGNIYENPGLMEEGK